MHMEDRTPAEMQDVIHAAMHMQTHGTASLDLDRDLELAVEQVCSRMISHDLHGFQ